MKIILKLIFILLLVLSVLYVVYIETERFQSNSVITVRDLSQKQTANPFDMILAQTSPVMQDSKLLELYIRSEDMYKYLDKEHNLSKYYTSKQIDPLRRLSDNIPLPSYQLSKENLLKEYNKDLFMLYDTPSTALKLGFAHADPKVAQSIVKTIIEYAGNEMNRLERDNANVALHFLEKQVDKSRVDFTQSVKEMINYQNEHNTFDPNLDVKSKSTILANLESELIKKSVEFQSGGKFMIKNSSQQKIAKRTISNLKKEIKRVKREIAGSGADVKELNQAVFDFEILRNNIDFTKEVYKKSLEKLEELRTQVNQNIKNLLVINQPSLAENYTYPNKTKSILTIFIVLGFLYSILISIITLLRDHRD